MALVPVRLRQDRRARGWKPASGWYIYDTCKLRPIDPLHSYRTKTETWEAIAKRLGVSVAKARVAWREDDCGR